ncbi:MAG: outer membrane beta-barrel protein [Dysgonamonadaceae bacterium]|jgi:hypothetical protein|nr:outer membrane beta-barrel protein [Dysgonamonadaceae bacterium]
MIRHSLFTILLFWSALAIGQKNLTISGTVIEEDTREPAVSASVELLTPKDSVYIKGDVAGTTGRFRITELSAGSYILKITYLGYMPYFKNVTLRSDQAAMNLGQITVKPDAILLKEAVVEGKVPEVTVRGDTIEYDAKSYKTPENAVLEDLIKRIPGAEVDDNGNVKIGGKSVTQFMVDGKDFFKDDPQIASKNLPAEMVEKLKVFNRRTEQAQMTGFDDGEEETVIDLTTKAGAGLNGTIVNAQAGAGADLQNDNDLRYSGSAFANHSAGSDRYTIMLGANNTNNLRGGNVMGGGGGGGGGGGMPGITKAKNLMFDFNKEVSKTLQINGNVGYMAQDNHSETTSETTTIADVQSQLDNAKNYTNYNGDRVFARARIEWKPNEQNTLIIRPNASINLTGNDGDQTTQRLDYNTMQTIFNANTLSDNKSRTYSFGGNLDFAHRFSSKEGRVFSVSARGTLSNSWSQGRSYWKSDNYTNGVYDNTTYRNQRSENDNDNSTYRIDVSYVEPLSSKFLLQAVYRISQTETDAINSTYDILGTPLFDYSTLMDTAVINPSQSRSTSRTSTEQRFGLNLKLRETKKYDLTFGFNIDPTKSVNKTLQPSTGLIPNYYIAHDLDGRLNNIMGDSVISTIEQNVVNFSPVVSFRYEFGERSSLRFNYEGQTSQPSAAQLRDYIDERDPTNLVQGNPELKPGYTNQLRLEFSKYVPETQLMYRFNANGNISFNDIASVTQMLDQGKRLTTYRNINGNWNSSVMGMFNVPLKNKRFTVSDFTMFRYTNSNSFVNDKQNIGKSTAVSTMPGINFKTTSNENSKTSLFIGLNGNFSYNNVVYTLNTENNQRTFNLGGGGFFTLELPYNWVIDSNINYSKVTGLSAAYNVPQTLWNASIAKNRILSGKYGNGGLKLELFDILQNRRSITASSTTNGFSATESLVMPSYFLLSFVYNFTNFQAPQGSGRFPFGGPPPGGGGFRGGGGGGFGGGGRF